MEPAAGAATPAAAGEATPTAAAAAATTACSTTQHPKTISLLKSQY